MTLGQLVKQKLDKKDISVKHLSDMTGIAPTTLYSFFKRGNDNINISTLFKIAHVLDTSVDNLVEELEAINTPTKKTNLDLSINEQKIIEQYRAVSPVAKNYIEDTLFFITHYKGEYDLQEERQIVRALRIIDRPLREFLKHALDPYIHKFDDEIEEIEEVEDCDELEELPDFEESDDHDVLVDPSDIPAYELDDDDWN